MVLLSMPIFLYFYIIIVILMCYSIYPLGDYDYTNYDCESRVGYFVLSYIKNSNHYT